MTKFDLLFNDANRLRSGWRLLCFVVLYLSVAFVFGAGLSVLGFVLPSGIVRRVLTSNWGFVVQGTITFLAAAIAGYVCNRLIESLPWRALGWALHSRWWRDLLFGIVVGGATLLLAVALPAVTGSYKFMLTPANLLPSVISTLIVSGVIFLFGAAAEEMLFRGYPLQTLLRAQPAWVALLLTSVLFASVHLNNPNVVVGWTFINTTLAGVWFAVAYLRTRDLWFPFGIHWAWNWMQAAVVGIPVSGITRIAPTPLLRGEPTGPEWLTGGAYGIEGGAACTFAIVISTFFILRTKALRADKELRLMTSTESPRPITVVARREEAT